MIIDPAPDWVAPYWEVMHGLNDPVIEAATTIWVVNPGPAPAHVTVTFHTVPHGIFETSSQTIHPRSMAQWDAAAGQTEGGVSGWVSITSDVAVLPSGVITHGSTGTPIWTHPMTFGRWDWVKIRPPHFAPVP